jgi:membrane glycosyltransferase
MRSTRTVLVTLFVLVVLGLAADAHAVIYKYTDEKGNPAYADDLGKVPERERPKAVIVTGQTEQELADDAERARALAARQAAQRIEAQHQQQAQERFTGRLIRGGIALALAVALIMVLSHIDALREQAELLRRIRLILVLVLFVFLGATFAGDVAGLFRSVGREIADPVAGIQEKQAEKGKKAAESYKAIDQALQEKAQQDAERIHRQFDEAEKGK